MDTPSHAGWLVLHDQASVAAAAVRKAAMQSAALALSLAHFAAELDFAADAPPAAALLRAGAVARPAAVMAGALQLYEMAAAAVSAELLRLGALRGVQQPEGDHAALEEDARLRQRAFAQRAAALREALGRPPPAATEAVAVTAAAAGAADLPGGGAGAAADYDDWSDHTVVWLAATADIVAVSPARAADGFVVECAAAAAAGKAHAGQLLLAPTAAEALEWTQLLNAIVAAGAA